MYLFTYYSLIQIGYWSRAGENENQNKYEEKVCNAFKILTKIQREHYICCVKWIKNKILRFLYVCYQLKYIYFI